MTATGGGKGKKAARQEQGKTSIGPGGRDSTWKRPKPDGFKDTPLVWLSSSNLPTKVNAPIKQFHESRGKALGLSHAMQVRPRKEELEKLVPGLAPDQCKPPMSQDTFTSNPYIRCKFCLYLGHSAYKMYDAAQSVVVVCPVIRTATEAENRGLKLPPYRPLAERRAYNSGNGVGKRRVNGRASAHLSEVADGGDGDGRFDQQLSDFRGMIAELAEVNAEYLDDEQLGRMGVEPVGDPRDDFDASPAWHQDLHRQIESDGQLAHLLAGIDNRAHGPESRRPAWAAATIAHRRSGRICRSLGACRS